MKKIIDTPLSLWRGELSSEVCNSIIAEGLELDLETAGIDKTIDTNIRKNKVGWFEENGWIDNLLFNYVSKTNMLNGWNFHITDKEKPQFTVYESNEFYNWHRDCDVTRPLQRKISVTVQLSNPFTYEGGDFNIKDYWGEKELNIHPDSKIEGTIIIFASSLLHTVFPVTQGVRYSLVQWYSGPDFI